MNPKITTGSIHGNPPPSRGGKEIKAQHNYVFEVLDSSDPDPDVRALYGVSAKPSDDASTFTVCPSWIFPSNNLIDSLSTSSFWISLFSGRAP
jgi:hypothetical protein